jgi:transposase
VPRLRLLADKVVEVKIADSVSHETILRVLKDNELKPWLKEAWCIPPKANAEIVYHMEDVLDVYTQPADPGRPLVCFDESPEQLVSEARQPLHLCMDRGYDYPQVRELVEAYGYTAHIRARGEEATAKKQVPGYRARRWVVERTHSWLNRFRRLLIRWEKKVENYLALLHFACAWITFRAPWVVG